jgi:hypothetical protein
MELFDEKKLEVENFVTGPLGREIGLTTVFWSLGFIRIQDFEKTQ